MTTLPATSLLRPAAENLDVGIAGAPVLWRRPDPTPRLMAVAGADATALRRRMRNLASSFRFADVFDVTLCMTSFLAFDIMAFLAFSRWPLDHPAWNFLFMGCSLAAAVTSALRFRWRHRDLDAAFGGGVLHPREARPEDFAVTSEGFVAAGRSGEARRLPFAQAHALWIQPRGEGDHVVRITTSNQGGESTFLEASRIGEADARGLVEALRGRILRFEGEAARFEAELAERTIVLPPETFAAARAAVAAGRFESVAALARSALERTLAA